MKESTNYQKDIESIRELMERSTKFISLSGLSGILSGMYALIGAAMAYLIIYYSASHVGYNPESVQNTSIIIKLIFIASTVLVASLSSGYWFTLKKSKKLGVKINDANTARLILNLAIPLLTGGVFILIILIKGYYGIIAPACLIFYGLALINASPNLYQEVRYLGYSEILVGLVCTYFSGYGLLFWAIGFGSLHIVYGAVMYKKYEA